LVFSFTPNQIGKSPPRYPDNTAALGAAAGAAAAAMIGNRVVFSIDNYKILNQAPGPPAYFYTPSNYKMVLDGRMKTDPVIITAAGATPR